MTRSGKDVVVEGPVCERERECAVCWVQKPENPKAIVGPFYRESAWWDFCGRFSSNFSFQISPSDTNFLTLVLKKLPFIISFTSSLCLQRVLYYHSVFPLIILYQNKINTYMDAAQIMENNIWLYKSIILILFTIKFVCLCLVVHKSF